MKRLLLACLLCLASAAANAATVTFAWDVSAGAAGYRLFCGSATGVYTTQVFDLNGAPVMNQQAVTTFAPGTYFCAMKAYTPLGAVCAANTLPNVNCSAATNEVTFAVVAPPLPAPGNLRITITLTWNPATQKFDMKVAKAAIP